MKIFYSHFSPPIMLNSRVEIFFWYLNVKVECVKCVKILSYELHRWTNLFLSFPILPNELGSPIFSVLRGHFLNVTKNLTIYGCFNFCLTNCIITIMHIGNNETTSTVAPLWSIKNWVSFKTPIANFWKHGVLAARTLSSIRRQEGIFL